MSAATLEQVVRNLTGKSPTMKHLLRQMVNNDQLGIVLLDNNGHINFFNIGAEKLTGYQASEVIGQNLSLLINHPKSARQILDEVAKVGYYLNPDATIIGKGLRQVPVNVSLAEIVDDLGNMSGVVAMAYDLSSLKTAENKIRQGRDYLNALLNNLSDAVIAVDRDRHVVFCNRAIRNVFAIGVNDAIGKPIHEIMKVSQSGGELAPFFNEDQPYEGSLKLCIESNKVFCALVASSPVIDARNNKQGWVVSVRDITEQVQASESLAAANRLVAASTDIGRVISEGLPLHSLLERFIDAIMSEMNLLGAAIYLTDMQARTAVLEVERDVAGAFKQQFSRISLDNSWGEQIIAKRRVVQLAVEINPASEMYRLLQDLNYLRTLAMPLHYRDKLVGFIALIPNLEFKPTEMRLLEALGAQAALAIGNAMLVRDLRESQRKYSTVVEMANDGIMISQSGEFRFVNKKLADMLGYNVSDMVDMDIRKVIPEADMDETLRRYRSRISGAVPREIYQARLIDKNGTIIPVEFNACTIEFDGRPASLSFVRDITTRLRLQEEVLAQKEMAELYTDVLTHDINNFIQNLLGYLDAAIVSIAAEEPVKQEAYLNKCKNSIHKITETVDRVREIMHIQTIEAEHLSPHSLAEQIQEAIEITMETFPKTDIHFHVDVPDSALILGHPLMVLIFLNLFTNAVKHNSNTEKEIDVRVEPHQVRGRTFWRITVTDNGRGIDESQRKKIFKRFERFSKSKGKGLGMSIVHALVQRLSGEVHLGENATSTLGGLTIHIDLPKA